MQVHDTTSSGVKSTRYWLLLRESSHDRREALQTQEHALRAYVKERGGVGVSMDDGYSGELLDRPALNESLDAAARKRYDVLLVDDPSRLAWGSLKNWYHLKAELTCYGVRLEAAGGLYEDDGESEVGAAMEAMMVAAVTIPRRATKRKMRQGKIRCWENGFVWASVANYGHVYHPGGEHAGYWEINEAERPWVERMFEMAVGGYSLGAITRYLTEHQVPTRRGGRWWPGTVRQVLQNPKHKGLFVACRYEPVLAARPYAPRRAGHGRKKVRTSSRMRPAGQWLNHDRVYEHLRIVSDDVWERANAQLARNKQTSARNTRDPSLLHGLVVCGAYHDHGQERRMSYQYREGKRSFWRCKWQADPCSKRCGSYATAHLLEEAVWQRYCQLGHAPRAALGDVAAFHRADREAV